MPTPPGQACFTHTRPVWQIVWLQWIGLLGPATSARAIAAEWGWSWQRVQQVQARGAQALRSTTCPHCAAGRWALAQAVLATARLLRSAPHGEALGPAEMV
jgi:hypothetical protein